MSILIKKPGILTTVQDGGRFGYRELGVNPSGPMDGFAARIANLLLGNANNSAVIKPLFPAVEIEFLSDTQFAICGAEFGACLDGKQIRNWTSHNAVEGQTLSFHRPERGSRGYVAIVGGIGSERWLDSSSSTQVAAGERFAIGRSLVQLNELSLSPWMLPRYGRFPTVRVTRGPEFELLDEAAVNHFLSENYTISNGSNRMGARLEGSPISCEGIGEMPSSAVTFGTIQLLPSGMPVVLMADHQTTGGYPRIATVAVVDLPLLGQLSAGDGVSFKLIEMSEAMELLQQREKDIEQLKCGVSIFGRTVNAK